MNSFFLCDHLVRAYSIHLIITNGQVRKVRRKKGTASSFWELWWLRIKYIDRGKKYEIKDSFPDSLLNGGNDQQCLMRHLHQRIEVFDNKYLHQWKFFIQFHIEVRLEDQWMMQLEHLFFKVLQKNQQFPKSRIVRLESERRLAFWREKNRTAIWSDSFICIMWSLLFCYFHFTVLSRVITKWVQLCFQFTCKK